MKTALYLIVAISLFSCTKEKPGCTHNLATNYNPNAIGGGECVYPVNAFLGTHTYEFRSTENIYGPWGIEIRVDSFTREITIEALPQEKWKAKIIGLPFTYDDYEVIGEVVNGRLEYYYPIWGGVHTELGGFFQNESDNQMVSHYYSRASWGSDPGKQIDYCGRYYH